MTLNPRNLIFSMESRVNINRNFIFYLLIFLSFGVFSKDSDKPIFIKASSAEIDEIAGLSIYQGLVKITQGSLIITANEIKVYNDKKKISKVIAYGDKASPAYYKQDRKLTERFVEAKAQEIIYIINDEMVHLKGEANLIQGYDSFSGNTLDYDIKNDRVIAKKSEDGKDRVKFKIRL